MITTGIESRIKIQDIVSNQVPSFISDENPKFIDFLKTYYISQEYQGGPTNLSDNLDQYLKLDNLVPEVIVDNSTTVGITTVGDKTINVTSTKGFPQEYGLIKIDDEIISYTGITTNSFTGCIRGFSGITNYHNILDKEEIVFNSTLASSHNSDASIENPVFRKYVEEYGMDPVDVLKLGIKPERSFASRFAPSFLLASSALPFVLPQPEVDDTDYVQQARDDFYISYAAEGGEMTGGVANNGRKIEHPNGKVKEHPKRIGEIAGPGTGTSDDIPAMLSDGEFVMTAQAVRNAGGGSRKEGAKNMYKLMKNLEKGGTLSQQSIGMA